MTTTRRRYSSKFKARGAVEAIRGELLALKWADVDFGAGEIRLSRGVVRQHVGQMKTEASRKPVPLDAVLAQVLANWRGRCPYNQDADFIFASPDKDGK